MPSVTEGNVLSDRCATDIHSSQNNTHEKPLAASRSMKIHPKAVFWGGVEMEKSWGDVTEGSSFADHPASAKPSTAK